MSGELDLSESQLTVGSVSLSNRHAPNHNHTVLSSSRAATADALYNLIHSGSASFDVFTIPRSVLDEQDLTDITIPTPIQYFPAVRLGVGESGGEIEGEEEEVYIHLATIIQAMGVQKANVASYVNKFDVCMKKWKELVKAQTNFATRPAARYSHTR